MSEHRPDNPYSVSTAFRSGQAVALKDAIVELARVAGLGKELHEELSERQSKVPLESGLKDYREGWHRMMDGIKRDLL